ncbi:MAG: PIN domain-containing protein [Candidatus Peregrinibacteria bacterium]|nr:PIN domain-containing protein [Candidatus Peregrinibacteria bacterium]
MVILDSSVVIAIFKDSDVHHEKAKEIFYREDDLVIPTCALIEILSILKMKKGLDAVQKCTEFIYNAENIDIYEISNQLVDEAIQFYIKHKNNLSFTDTLLLALSNKTKIPLITFDQELAKIAAKNS